ncbi:hypothetical protein [Xanthomonas perforans]|uniref:hypothetical protein n=1 Tax=Xanthomonas perforans TaxID=442694 RepID=UPI0023599832|nr:hypothetical protein [Xanthomonas perforans]MDC9654378.1 hypothetical protein [Xanthomonas perforans]MEB2158940.1 hypothetical protein [Xanthomonas campestris pv. campestris]
MKWFFLILIVCCLANAWESSQQAPIKADRANEQRALLAQLDAVQTPAAKELVSDWRRTYPTPSAESLEELQLVVERVQRDPVAAESMTIAAKEKYIANLPWEPVIGGHSKAAPGL